MPRNIPTNLLNHLKQDYQILATLILLQRKDGLTLAFTTWDVPVTYNGNTYIPAISLSPSGVKNSYSSSDQMDIMAAIDSTYITEQDIDAGRYDNCSVTIMTINPQNPSWGIRIDIKGTIGQITSGDGQFQADVDSLSKNLEQNIGQVITPLCRVKHLGDAECKVNIASYRFTRTVTAIAGDNQTITFSDTHGTGYYDYGMIYFNNAGSGGGLNYSLSMDIKTSVLSGSNNIVTLQEPMPYAIHVGDTVVLEAGCDRRGITCRAKFNNLINFHGEPYCPGNAYLLNVGRPPS